MPYSPVDIINQGLGKFSASRIRTITPPSSALEAHCTGYTQWKESELAKRRWVFATNKAYDLPGVVAVSTRDDFTFRYELPNTVLRPIRGKRTEWSQEGRYVFSNTEDLTIPVILNVAEGQFDPLFVDVLACRVWLECVSKVTQSRTGIEDAQIGYDRAVADAGKNNAFVIGPEDVNDDDTAFDFLTGRW